MYFNILGTNVMFFVYIPFFLVYNLLLGIEFSVTINDIYINFFKFLNKTYKYKYIISIYLLCYSVIDKKLNDTYYLKNVFRSYTFIDKDCLFSSPINS